MDLDIPQPDNPRWQALKAAEALRHMADPLQVIARAVTALALKATEGDDT